LTDVLAVGERQAAAELELLDPVEPVEAVFEEPEREVGFVETAEQEDPGIGGRERVLVIDRPRTDRAVLGEFLSVSLQVNRLV
jgi:hypothetical protein